MSETTSMCKAMNRQGKPCRAAATESGFCHFHANPGVAAELGRAGGRRNRRVNETELRALPPLNDAAGVQDALAQTIVEVHEKRLHPRTAAGLAPLFSTLFRTFERTELEREIKSLRQRVNELEGTMQTQKAERDDV